MNKILNRIIEYRKAKGLVQKQMADKLEIAQVNYGKIENGKTELTLDRLLKIADILEVSVNELINPDFNPDNLSKELQEENLNLKNQIEEKDELIKLLKDKITHITHGFTSQINGNCFWQVNKIDRKIAEGINEEEKLALLTEREKIIEDYKKEREFNLGMGLLTKQDFEANFEYLSWLYENMPDRDILK